VTAESVVQRVVGTVLAPRVTPSQDGPVFTPPAEAGEAVAS
jgi:hypothetical protein